MAEAFEFVRPALGTWTVAAQNLPTCNEEAAHAVVGALMGLELLEVKVDSPDDGVAGHVLVSSDLCDISCQEDLDRAYYKRLLTVLAGPVFTDVGTRSGGHWTSMSQETPGWSRATAGGCATTGWISSWRRGESRRCSKTSVCIRP